MFMFLFRDDNSHERKLLLMWFINHKAWATCDAHAHLTLNGGLHTKNGHCCIKFLDTVHTPTIHLLEYYSYSMP